MDSISWKWWKMTVLVIFCLLLTTQAEKILRNSIGGIQYPSSFHSSGRASPDSMLSFSVALVQQNLDLLKSRLAEISDINHPKYGTWLSKDELGGYITPGPKAISRVVKWLENGGVERQNIAISPDSIKCRASVEVIESLFHTEMHNWIENRPDMETGKIRSSIRQKGGFSIPSELSDVIDGVHGLSEFWPNNLKYKPKKVTSVGKMTKNAAENTTDSAASRYITPAFLREYYRVGNGVGRASNNLQAIGAFNDYYSQDSFTQFNLLMGLDGEVIPKGAPSCLPQSCDQFESDLDVQYITGMGQGIPTWFYEIGPGYFVLEWAEEINNLANPPLVHSLSYGFAEIGQCAALVKGTPPIAGHCKDADIGYSWEKYLDRTNTELMKLALRGVSIIVSSGDDGSVGLTMSPGNIPGDPNAVCPVGCQWLSNATKHDYCPVTNLQLTTTNPDVTGPVNFPFGQDSPDGLTVLISMGNKVQDLANSFIAANPTWDLGVKGGGLPFYAFCGQWGPVVPVTMSAGYPVYEYTLGNWSYDPLGPHAVTPDFPASSPYITSVGATQLTDSPYVICDDTVLTQTGNNPVLPSCQAGEVPASIETGSIITGGSGFSEYFDVQDYQKDVVDHYFEYMKKRSEIDNTHMMPETAFRRSGRAYPDVSALGHSYLVSIGVGANGTAPFLTTPVDGTSASAPAFAGLISLLNDEMLLRGLPPLGFLNPLLYTMAKENPKTFTDIVKGDTRCNRNTCPQWGFDAAPGWDPATGLGTPVYAEMLAYLLEKRVYVNKSELDGVQSTVNTYDSKMNSEVKQINSAISENNDSHIYKETGILVAVGVICLSLLFSFVLHILLWRKVKATPALNLSNINEGLVQDDSYKQMT